MAERNRRRNDKKLNEREDRNTPGNVHHDAPEYADQQVDSERVRGSGSRSELEDETTGDC